MILTCPECATRYVVNPVNLRPNGRTVRCARCSHTWFEAPPAPNPDEVTDNSGPQPGATPMGDTSPPQGIPTPQPEERQSRRAAGRTAPRANLPALPRGRDHGPVLGWIALVLFVTAVVGGVLAFPRPLAAAWPDMIKLYAVLGIDPHAAPKTRTTGPQSPALPPLEKRLLFQDLQPSQLYVDGVLTLTIKGQVRNVGTTTEHLPTIKVVLLDGSGLAIKTWTAQAQQQQLTPGDSAAFETQLPNPPPDAQDIRVTFDLPADGG